jgi:AAA domain-containing protein
VSADDLVFKVESDGLLPAGFLNVADLLAEPDPGPTPWLVKDLIVDAAIVAAVGRWKTTKSFGLLEIAMAIVAGIPVFGALEVPEPGDVLYVNEESGKAALWRRVDALARGRGISREALRGLVVAPNARVKLDDPEWQKQLLELGQRKPWRLIVFDPLARMKAPSRDESAQKEMAEVIEFVRQLRDASGAAVGFVHHTGHAGEQMRGSSDLESVWETRLTWKKSEDGLVTVTNEHREAESGPPVNYRVDWHHETRSMRLRNTSTPLREAILGWLQEHGHGQTEEIATGIGRRRDYVASELAALSGAGTTHSGPSGRTDKLGRPIRDKVWKLSSGAGLWPVPDAGRATEDMSNGQRGSLARPPLYKGDVRDEPPDEAEIERLAELARSDRRDDDIPF